MSGYCDKCEDICEFTYVRDDGESDGRRWEVYRCVECGQEIAFAVG